MLLPMAVLHLIGHNDQNDMKTDCTCDANGISVGIIWCQWQ